MRSPRIFSTPLYFCCAAFGCRDQPRPYAARKPRTAVATTWFDPLVGRRPGKIENQRLQHCRLAGIEKLGRRDFNVLNREIAGGDRIFEIAAEPGDAVAGPVS